MKIAVLFDGAGLARLGLEQAGHECTGVELDPVKHHFSTLTGSGNSVLQDATTFALEGFDAVWASPPCQSRSVARTQGPAHRFGLIRTEDIGKYSGDFVDWCLGLQTRVLWVENTVVPGIQFGQVWNAAQFLEVPIQNRNRVIGGRYGRPKTFRPQAYYYPHLKLCPTITATEYRGCASDRRRASRFYGRKLTLQECAYHQGFVIPEGWAEVPKWFWGTPRQWEMHQFEAVGNGVPIYMAKAFGEVYK